ncbi:unnamed protein product, partial [Scytosiphon promiscuus]
PTAAPLFFQDTNQTNEQAERNAHTFAAAPEQQPQTARGTPEREQHADGLRAAAVRQATATAVVGMQQPFVRPVRRRPAMQHATTTSCGYRSTSRDAQLPRPSVRRGRAARSPQKEEERRFLRGEGSDGRLPRGRGGHGGHGLLRRVQRASEAAPAPAADLDQQQAAAATHHGTLPSARGLDAGNAAVPRGHHLRAGGGGSGGGGGGQDGEAAERGGAGRGRSYRRQEHGGPRADGLGRCGGRVSLEAGARDQGGRGCPREKAGAFAQRGRGGRGGGGRGHGSSGGGEEGEDGGGARQEAGAEVWLPSELEQAHPSDSRHVRRALPDQAAHQGRRVRAGHQDTDAHAQQGDAAAARGGAGQGADSEGVGESVPLDGVGARGEPQGRGGGEELDGGGQHAHGDLHRQEVPTLRGAPHGPHSGGFPRPHPSGRKVRSRTGIQAQHLLGLVDTAVHIQGYRAPEPHDSAADARAQPAREGEEGPEGAGQLKRLSALGSSDRGSPGHPGDAVEALPRAHERVCVLRDAHRSGLVPGDEGEGLGGHPRGEGKGAPGEGGGHGAVQGEAPGGCRSALRGREDSPIAQVRAGRRGKAEVSEADRRDGAHVAAVRAAARGRGDEKAPVPGAADTPPRFHLRLPAMFPLVFGVRVLLGGLFGGVAGGGGGGDGGVFILSTTRDTRRKGERPCSPELERGVEVRAPRELESAMSAGWVCLSVRLCCLDAFLDLLAGTEGERGGYRRRCD